MSKTEDVSQLNIYQRLAKVRKQVEVIQRDKKAYNYRYVSEDEILAKISGYMDKYNLSLIPGIIHSSRLVTPYHTKKTKAMKSGEIYEENVNEVLVSADMTFRWVNNDNPEEFIEVPWTLVGHQIDGSQSLGSGLSYAMRYFLLKFFNIATPDDDPDAWRSKQKAAVDAEDKIITDAIVKKIDDSVRVFLADHSDKADEVKKLASKYAKGGNYKTIASSTVAAKMLEDFQQTYGVKE